MKSYFVFGLPTLVAVNLGLAHVGFNLICAAWIALMSILAAILEAKDE